MAEFAFVSAYTLIAISFGRVVYQLDSSGIIAIDDFGVIFGMSCLWPLALTVFPLLLFVGYLIGRLSE